MTDKSKIGRRGFLKTSAVGAAGIALLAENVDAAVVIELAMPSSTSERRIIPLNDGWLYSESNRPGSTDVAHNDRGYKQVTIPHTNKLLPASGFDENEYTFVSVYRRHFRLPAGLANHRIFIDFGGVMTAARVFINGADLGEYRGGYTPFSFELTQHIKHNANNVLAVVVDSTERRDIPPFGGMIDYLTFGGIYRDVQIRAVAKQFISNVFAKPVNVLSDRPEVAVKTYIEGTASGKPMLMAELLDGENVIGSARYNSVISPGDHMVTISGFGRPRLWEVSSPNLYTVRVTITDAGRTIDQYETRIGFREAKFTTEGFFLNGKRLKLRGLNRHQTYPFVGQAMPARVQKRDAWILRKELYCNIVRTSHYPQSPAFLDACDEYGLLVFEEIPGWQHIGDKAWQDLSVQYVGEMIRRDWNHPSIVMWGVRVNESGDNHDFYTRTNQLAHELDDSRQTGGVRYRYESERLEDVFTMNDFRWPMREPNHPLYIVTEFNGHMFPTKRFDNIDRIREHTHRHARVHDHIAGIDKIAGGIGWCAFDYNTHDYFGSGDRICYHGVSDIYRMPKAAAGFYKSQCEPSEEVVLEPAFHWACGDENEAFTQALVSSNCERVKYFVNDKLIADVEADRKTYTNLKYPPFSANLRPAIWGDSKWSELRLEGWIGGKKVIERRMSGKGVDQKFAARADDKEIHADGIDMTRVTFQVTDEFGNPRPYAQAVVQFTVENGEIVGDSPFALVAGGGAIWIRSTKRAGMIRLTAKHPRLGTSVVEIKAV
jgi:beta-galactosidase